MKHDTLCWFVHDSVTATVGRRAVTAATLVTACALLALSLAGAA